MKKFVKKLCVLCLLIGSFVVSGFTQNNPTEAIKLAEHFKSIDNYQSATKMYLKAYFLDRNSDFTTLPLSISESFYKLKDYINAKKYIGIYIRQPDLSLNDQMEAKYFKLRLLFEQKLYKECLSSLYQFSAKHIEHDPDKYHYYLALTYALDKKYEDCNETVVKLSYQNQIPEEELSRVFNKLQKNDTRWNYKYNIMSMFVPGLGQFVYGDYSDALNSFFINAGFLSLFVYIQQTLSFSDALVSVAPWFGRYYIGGLNNVSAGSKRHQNDLANKYIIELNQMINGAKF